MNLPLPLPRALRRVRGVVGLVVLTGLAVPLIATSQAVAVTVDGEEYELRTYAETVGDVLEELELDVASRDEVSPAPQTTVEDGLEIDVARAREVEVRVDGEVVETVHEPVHSVAGVLEAADLGDVREQGALITPAWTDPVDDGDVVEVSLPTTVRLQVDGESREIDTHTTTVEHLLLEQDVELGDEDVVAPGLDAPVDEVDEVVVQRVAYDEVVEETVLEREVVREETDELDRGTTRVVEEGRDGLRRDVYRVELVDGEEADRERVEREVVTEPRDRVVRVGTRTPPPPEPSTPSGSVWDRLAQCESNGNWQSVSANGLYYGGLQFHLDTWNRHKPSGYPSNPVDASREQQIRVGQRLQARQGWSAWPHCSRQLGLR